jgi:hypothetical protein
MNDDINTLKQLLWKRNGEIASLKKALAHWRTEADRDFGTITRLRERVEHYERLYGARD